MDKQENQTVYVVVRDGKRVCDEEYLTPDDPRALSWVKHYQNIIKKYPDGTRVEVVKYDNKKHRVW
jgi:ribosomal protein L24E